MTYYTDPIILRMRSGQDGDEYLSITEQHKVINNKVWLTEIPNYDDKVSVSGNSVIWTETRESDEIDETEYYVDYNNGQIFFHPSKEGLTLTFSYIGKGANYIPASRIVTNSIDGEIIQTLNEVVDAASSFTHMGAYSPSTLYRQFNMVNYQGGTFMYISQTPSSGNSPINISHWKKITGFQWRGTYSASATYNAGDTVIDTSKEIVYQSIVDENVNQSLSDGSKWVKLISVKEAVDNINDTNNDIQLAETSRVAAENNRVSTEASRVSAESSRVSAESARVSAETTRSSNETTRQNNEATRQSQENTRQTNTANAITNIQQVRDSFVHLDSYSAAIQYYVNNEVRYNGATYRCKANSKGNLPTNTNYWILIAAKGTDGLGTVTSLTSDNGDIIIDSTDANYPDLSINAGTGSNQFVKRNSSGQIDDVVAIENELSSHEINSAPHQYGNRFEWRYNPSTDSLELVVLS